MEPWGYTADADHWCKDCLREHYPGTDERWPGVGEEDSEGNEPGACFDEVDSPAHCCQCGDLLDAPLTSDGLDYVIEAYLDELEHRNLSGTMLEWLDHYDITPKSIQEYFERLREKAHA